jgi:hypothetical protein
MNIMRMKRTTALAVVLTALVSALAFAPPPASARVYVSGGVRVYAPYPAIRHERVLVRPGSRYVWVPGYWNWAGSRYVWIGGRWALPPRPGAIWVAPRVVYRYHHPYYYGGYWRHHGRRW